MYSNRFDTGACVFKKSSPRHVNQQCLSYCDYTTQQASTPTTAATGALCDHIPLGRPYVWHEDDLRRLVYQKYVQAAADIRATLFTRKTHNPTGVSYVR